MASVPTLYVIGRDDAGRDDVRRLVQTHRSWSLQQTPAEFSFSIEPDAIADAGIVLLTARSPEGELLGIGGIKELDTQHGEIKTMHTIAEVRGRGVGRALLQALLEIAAERGYERVSLETGTDAAFLAARRLYESVGFRPSAPFGSYLNTQHNMCMTLFL